MLSILTSPAGRVTLAYTCATLAPVTRCAYNTNCTRCYKMKGSNSNFNEYTKVNYSNPTDPPYPISYGLAKNCQAC